MANADANAMFWIVLFICLSTICLSTIHLIRCKLPFAGCVNYRDLRPIAGSAKFEKPMTLLHLAGE